jgi:hypothetical protein
MRYALMLTAALGLLAACDPVPTSIKNHPDKAIVNIDDHKIYVVKQAGNQWVAAGGEKDQDGFVEYRQKRAIEVQSKCRVNKVLSAKGAPLLRASVHQCRK